MKKLLLEEWEIKNKVVNELSIDRSIKSIKCKLKLTFSTSGDMSKYIDDKGELKEKFMQDIFEVIKKQMTTIELP